MIKFVSDLRQVNGFLLVLAVSSTNKIDGLHITEILLKVALNTIPEALKSLYRSPGNKKKQLVLCKNYVLQW